MTAFGHDFLQQKRDRNTLRERKARACLLAKQRGLCTIDVNLNETTKEISGSETITYTNNSPDALGFLVAAIGSEFI